MNFKEEYDKKITTALMEELNIKNKFSVPKISKIVINVGVGRMSKLDTFNNKLLPELIKEIGYITGQKPAIASAKKSIAGFKVRQGNIVGLKATIRGKRMYDFVEKLVKAVFPRMRDFRGISLKNVDNSGNLNLGFKEHVIFPEIDQDLSNVDFGLQVTIVTNARSRGEAIKMYKKIGLLFKKETVKK